MAVKYNFNSLEDFLVSTTLTVDGQLDDGWGAAFPVKGREIDATILFSDISNFSRRTLDLSSTETLIFVNNFFAWMSAEALRGRKCIVDKYIGDEIMVVFSREFGSEDPFLEAIDSARWMAENDFLAFCPHIGIASGRVTIGYVGTPIKYNCSVFGAPVAMAARCAGVKPQREKNQFVQTSIVFPAADWADRDFDSIIPPRESKAPDGTVIERRRKWQLNGPFAHDLKNIGQTELLEIIKLTVHDPHDINAEDKARDGLRYLQENNRYWPTHAS